MGVSPRSSPPPEPQKLAPRSDPGHEKEKESPPENASDFEKQLREENARIKEKQRQMREEQVSDESLKEEHELVKDVKDGKVTYYYNGSEVPPDYPRKEVSGDDPHAHMEKVTNKSSRCLICPEKKASLTGNILKHVEFQHMGKTPGYACPICVPEKDKKLPIMLPQNLKQHLKTKKHTDKTKLWCRVADCPKNYTDNKNLVAHYLEVHNMEKFKCPQCPFKFCIYEYYVEHVKEKNAQNHPEKPLPPEEFGMQPLGYVQRCDRVDESYEESSDVQMEVDQSLYEQDGESNQTHGRGDESNEESTENSVVPMDNYSSNNGEDSGLDQMYKLFSIDVRKDETLETFEIEGDDELTDCEMDEHFSTNGQDGVSNKPHGSVQTNYRWDASNEESINRDKVPMEIDSFNGQGGGSNQTYGYVQRYGRWHESNEESTDHGKVPMEIDSLNGQGGGSNQESGLASADDTWTEFEPEFDAVIKEDLGDEEIQRYYNVFMDEDGIDQ